MKKDTLRAIAAIAIILVVFLVIALVLPIPKTGTFWVSFAFSLISFGVAGGAIYFAFLRNGDAKSRFYGFPIGRLGLIYLAVQLVLGLVLMLLGSVIPPWLAAILQVIPLAAACLGLISAESVVAQIQVQDTKLKKDVSKMRALQSKVSQLAAQSDDKALKALAEEFRYSDPVSSEALEEVEADLSAAVDALQAAYIDGDKEILAQLCRKATAILAERNRLCKLNK